MLGGAVLVAALLAVNWVANADPKALARTMRQAGLATGVVAGSSLLGYLVLSGRFALLAPLAVFALPWARRRLMAGLGSAGLGARRSPASAGQASDVATAYLRMSLDHDSGVLDGEVLQGAFAGRRLGSLGMADLRLLLAECERADAESVPLVEAYLDRAHPGWRDEPGPDGAEAGAGGAGPMTAEEAWGVLGLAPGAADDEIRAAHHRLMKKLHPDQGGSTYLATKINQARDVLLGP